MMIRVLHYSPRSALEINFPVEKLDSTPRNKKGLLWVDFISEPNESCESMRDLVGGVLDTLFIWMRS
jgi:hypothetical protein